jgi:hypothetical protein
VGKKIKRHTKNEINGKNKCNEINIVRMRETWDEKETQRKNEAEERWVRRLKGRQRRK